MSFLKRKDVKSISKDLNYPQGKCFLQNHQLQKFKMKSFNNNNTTINTLKVIAVFKIMQRLFLKKMIDS